jgi:flavin reductase (DIM6/NTAB) family NADH-FMN oxidoreductase RutF
VEESPLDFTRVDSCNLSAEAAYKLLVGSIVPRPIAWVSTLSETGVVNLAPFSGFTFVSYRPPTLALSLGSRDGKQKDTARNIKRSGEFVVNICDDSLMQQVHQSSFEYPDDVSEAAVLGIDLIPSSKIAVPRVAICPINLECRLYRSLKIGDPPTLLVVGEVVTFHVRTDLLRDGKIDTAKLRPLARLGGPLYSKGGEILKANPPSPARSRT